MSLGNVVHTRNCKSAALMRWNSTSPLAVGTCWSVYAADLVSTLYGRLLTNQPNSPAKYLTYTPTTPESVVRAAPSSADHLTAWIAGWGCHKLDECQSLDGWMLQPGTRWILSYYTWQQHSCVPPVIFRTVIFYLLIELHHSYLMSRTGWAAWFFQVHESGKMRCQHWH